jgi:hypothetical protein
LTQNGPSDSLARLPALVNGDVNLILTRPTS